MSTHLYKEISKDNVFVCRSYDPKLMIEMDQFVHTLSGDASETIERLSKQSAATMKDIGTTVRR